MIFIATSVHSICVYEKDRSPFGPCVQLRIVICNNIEKKIRRKKNSKLRTLFFSVNKRELENLILEQKRKRIPTHILLCLHRRIFEYFKCRKVIASAKRIVNKL